jgi:hypothetical protein
MGKGRRRERCGPDGQSQGGDGLSVNSSHLAPVPPSFLVLYVGAMTGRRRRPDRGGKLKGVQRSWSQTNNIFDQGGKMARGKMAMNLGTCVLKWLDCMRLHHATPTCVLKIRMTRGAANHPSLALWSNGNATCDPIGVFFPFRVHILSYTETISF